MLYEPSDSSETVGTWAKFKKTIEWRWRRNSEETQTRLAKRESRVRSKDKGSLFEPAGKKGNRRRRQAATCKQPN
jgi:hypothetical protein